MGEIYEMHFGLNNIFYLSIGLLGLNHILTQRASVPTENNDNGKHNKYQI
jgi:hypothetical protein